MNKVIAICVLCVFIFNSCAIEVSPTTKTPMFGETEIIPTQTPVIPTLNPTETISVTITPTIKKLCLEHQSGETSMQQVARGTIMDLFASPGFILDLQTGIKYYLPYQYTPSNLGGGFGSPDGNRLAYIEAVKDDAGNNVGTLLWIVDSKARIKTKYNLIQISTWISRWLDNENILFYTNETDENGNVLVINLQSGEQQILRNDMPGLYIPEFGWGINWRVEYSPDMEEAMYINGDSYVVLINFRSAKILWQSIGPTWSDNVPNWSPNGKTVAYADGDQLLLIGQDGKVQVLQDDWTGMPSYPVWSPDGRYLVYWKGHHLMLYDQQNNTITDLCYEQTTYMDVSDFLWSPDSSKFVFDVYLDLGATLVDLQQGKLYQLTKIPGAYYPTVWMNSMP